MADKIEVNILDLVRSNFRKLIQDDNKNIFYLLYYSILESILLLVSPLTSAVIINSVLAHASLSVYVLSFIVVTIFLGIATLQVLKQYIVEKFEQKIFVQNAISVAEASEGVKDLDMTIDKYMNYFFDIISIQKLFPVLMLNGSSLLVKLIISLMLLFVFDINLFLLGIFFIILFMIMIFFLGKHGVVYSIERSNAKHEAIYFLQHIPYINESENIYEKLDMYLVDFVKARQKMFMVVIRQLSLTFFMEGIILSSFFILGGYLVFEGKMPIGEFVASEIIIISVTYALRDFMKQIDYVYDMLEGFYKIDKLSKRLRKDNVSL